MYDLTQANLSVEQPNTDCALGWMPHLTSAAARQSNQSRHHQPAEDGCLQAFHFCSSSPHSAGFISYVKT